MKKKLSILACVLLLLMACVAIFAQSESNKIERRFKDDTVKQQKQEQLKIKVTEGVERSWKDIKDQYKIKDDEYTQLDWDNLNDFKEGKIEGFVKVDECELIFETIILMHKDRPMGSVKPIVLVKKNKTEIIVAFKDKDGQNIKRVSNLSKDKYSEFKEEKKQGEPIAKIEGKN